MHGKREKIAGRRVEKEVKPDGMRSAESTFRAGVNRLFFFREMAFVHLPRVPLVKFPSIRSLLHHCTRDTVKIDFIDRIFAQRRHTVVLIYGIMIILSDNILQYICLVIDLKCSRNGHKFVRI